MVDNLTIKLDCDPNQPIREELRRRIRTWTRERAAALGHHGDEKVLTFSVTDDKGALVAGSIGEVFLGAASIWVVWVEPEYQKSGIGTRLMQRWELEARALGCKTMYLDTLDFQAAPFYEKLGFEKFGQHAFTPDGPIKYFLRKELD